MFLANNVQGTGSATTSGGFVVTDMTVDPELKFLLDNFTEYQEIIKNSI
jgi:hypothetical protein